MSSKHNSLLIFKGLLNILSLFIIIQIPAGCARFEEPLPVFGLLAEQGLFDSAQSLFSISPSGSETRVTEGGATDSYGFCLTRAPSATVTVSLSFDTAQITLNGSSVSPLVLNYSASNWDVPQSVDVQAVDDSLIEGNHSSDITHTSSSTDLTADGRTSVYSVQITDNDTPGVSVTETGGATNITEAIVTGEFYSIVLTNTPAADVNIDINFDPAQVTVNSSSISPVTLTFTTGNWSSAQDVYVEAVDDDYAEGPHTSSITHTSISVGDPGYDGLAVAGVTANITDNDTADISVVESFGLTEADEANPSYGDTYDIGPTSRPMADVQVSIAFDTAQLTVNGSGTSPVVLTFTNADWAARTVAVEAVDDDFDETTPHTSFITHSSQSPGDANYDGLTPATVGVRITDNDTAGYNFTESGSTNVEEGTVTGESYNVSLTSMPTADVIVTVTFDDTQVTVAGDTSSPASLTITPANWSTGVDIGVEAINDTIDEHNHNSTLSHAITSADGNYNPVLIPDTITVNIKDNEWYDGGDNCLLKRKLTFNNSGYEAFTDFPAMVKLTSSTISYGSVRGSDRLDIRFRDKNGTALSHEIESWNSGGTSIFWVKVPSIAVNDTDYIWMYYDCDFPLGADDPPNVWTNGYVGVYHFNEGAIGAGGAIVDSIGTYDGTNSSTTDATGLFGKARYYDGTTSSIGYPTGMVGLAAGEAGTVLAWAQPDSPPASGKNAYIFSHRTGTGTDDRIYLRIYNDGINNDRFHVGIANLYDTGGTNSTSAFPMGGGWSMVAITWWDAGANGNAQGYFDGQRVTVGNPITHARIGTAGTFRTGCYADPSCNGEIFTGRIDELRVANTARSANWIAAQYRSMSESPSSYINFSGDLTP